MRGPLAHSFTGGDPQATRIEFGDHVLNSVAQFFGRRRGAVLGAVFPGGVNDGLQLLAHVDDG